ncbi:MAG: carbon starvation protein A [Selenomonadaceae bacterium]|nr:carbon starvation protein A [Selenomonadaceae bacterium]
MITFIIGLVILIGGAAVYGSICDKIMKPDENVKTPAVKLNDGVDYVPMNKWRNTLIELLDIAGTGPVLGPIQGILFGPIAFITIPIGCVIGGAFHDYMSGMISLRNNGEQMPSLVKRFLGENPYKIYNVFICLLMLLVGAVFIYTPGDLFVAHILHGDAASLNSTVITVYAIIFGYYLIATLLPIDKIIGKIYPIFGLILLLSAVGIFFGLFINGYPLTEIWETGVMNIHPLGEHFIPMFFVTVACGITSGFHSTQATMIARSVTNEKHGRLVYYNTMIAEGFIAMAWAAAAMGAVNLGLATEENLLKTAAIVVGVIAKDMLGDIGGMIAVLGVVVLAITSGDTALRSLRIMLADALKIDSSKKKNTLTLALIIFAVVAGVLFFAKTNASGFSVLWRYFSWANETIAVFAFAMITVYMIKHDLPYVMAIIPGTFYMYIVSTYILHVPIGFGLDWTLSYILAAVFSAAYAFFTVKLGKKMLSEPEHRLQTT